jgi:hypothetical protein
MSNKIKKISSTKESELLESIANFSDRNSKMAWERKMSRMQRLLQKIQPIEEEIIELQAKKVPIYDEIQSIREDMVRECIHPFDYLIEKDGYVYCKFCEAKIKNI